MGDRSQGSIAVYGVLLSAHLTRASTLPALGCGCLSAQFWMCC